MQAQTQSATIAPRKEELMARRRFQMPSVRRRNGRRAYWYIQYWLDAQVGKGQIERKRKTQFLGYCPTTNDMAQRKKRGEATKREAERIRNEWMEKVNKVSIALESQVLMGDFLKVWLETHVSTLATPTRLKYESRTKNYIKPMFGEIRLCDIDTEVIQRWLNGLDHLSYYSRRDLRNMLSGIFSKAREWGYWHEGNPVEAVTAGRRRVVRQKRLLSESDTARLLCAIPADHSLVIELGRSTGCRISEILGLQEKHFEPETGWIKVEQRWWRGDLDVVKCDPSNRELPTGLLAVEIRKRLTGDPERFLFDCGKGEPWHDRTLLKTITRAAKRLGFYFLGFGFHSFRRRAITAIQAIGGASSIEAQLFAGHSQEAQTREYTIMERKRLQELVERMQRGGETETVQ